MRRICLCAVIARLDPAIHLFREERWTRGSSPRVTPKGPSLQVLATCDVVALFVVPLFRVYHHLRHAMALYGASDFANDVHRKEAHPLLLVGIESLVERLPGIGQPFQVGAALSQGLSASAH